MSPLSPHSQLLRVTSCAKCVWMLLLTVCCWSVGTCSHVSSVAVNWQNALSADNTSRELCMLSKYDVNSGTPFFILL